MDGGGAERAPWGGGYGQPYDNAHTEGWGVRRGYADRDTDGFDRRTRYVELVLTAGAMATIEGAAGAAVVARARVRRHPARFD